MDVAPSELALIVSRGPGYPFGQAALLCAEACSDMPGGYSVLCIQYVQYLPAGLGMFLQDLDGLSP